MKVLGPLKTDGVAVTAGPHPSRLYLYFLFLLHGSTGKIQLNSGSELPETYGRGIRISAVIVIWEVSDPQRYEKLFGHVIFGQQRQQITSHTWRWPPEKSRKELPLELGNKLLDRENKVRQFIPPWLLSEGKDQPLLVHYSWSSNKRVHLHWFI